MLANNATACESVLPLWSRHLAPDACVPELFVFLHSMLFTNIQLNFSPTLLRLLEHLSIKEPEAQEWTMMVAINIGTLLKYGQPQAVLWCADVLDRNPAATAVANSQERPTWTRRWKSMVVSTGRVAIWRLSMPKALHQSRTSFRV